MLGFWQSQNSAKVLTGTAKLWYSFGAVYNILLRGFLIDFCCAIKQNLKSVALAFIHRVSVFAMFQAGVWHIQSISGNYQFALLYSPK
jgi:hypothetical protein